MRAYERLIRYAKVHTSSEETGRNVPSTLRQFDLSRMLETELKELGFSDVYVDEHAYLYGSLPATPGMEDRPCVGLIAHLDTIPDEDFSGKDVQPHLVVNYNGSNIHLGTSGRVLSPERFPSLRRCIGHTIITTDGTTVLGADDKAGIAEILTACEQVLAQALPHGAIAVCFTPDEEIGHGAALLDLDRFAADFAYTVDGGEPNEINCETFNAVAAVVQITGENVHPGNAKNKMRSAAHVAMKYDSMLPFAERPEHTEGYEGYFHLTDLRANVEKATMRYIIRDHDAHRFEGRKDTMKLAAKRLNEIYGPGVVTVTMRDQYRNMAEVLTEHPEAVTRAEKAIRAVGLEPIHRPIRGGTDGAQLSFRGLPCPNLGTGGSACHGPYEHISVQDMDTVTAILKALITG